MKRLIYVVRATSLMLLYISFAAGVVFSFEQLSMEGPAHLSPRKPKWGDTVKVTYEPFNKETEILPGEPVYIHYKLKYPEKSENSWAKMDENNRIFQCKIKIPEKASYIFIYFITMDGYDRNATLKRMIFREDGFPAKGAWLWELSANPSKTDYLEAFHNERKIYPDFYLIYRNKWLNDFRKADGRAIIGQEIEALKKQATKETAGLLWAFSTGYLYLGKEDESREVLRRMVRIYPHSEHTAWALREYDNIIFSRQIKGEGPEEINRLKLELIREYPTSKNLRDYILPWASYQDDPPLDIIRPGFEAWIRDEPESPRPYYFLAFAFLKSNKHLNKASMLIEKALNNLLAGKLRLLHGDISGKRTERLMLDYYANAAAIHENINDFSTALAEIKTAQSLSKQNLPHLPMREASIWRNLGYFDKAEQSLLRARWQGGKNAEKELMEIYRKRYQTDEGFNVWLSEKTRKQLSTSPGNEKLAPGFEVKTLNGEILRLADLKGKVLVLNFWYISCAPCQVEIPSLNKLVDEFSGKDVVFIGFARDKPEELRSFLKEVPFKYQIVAEASAICSLYGISTYPTHVIIDKQGQVEFFLSGGRQNQDEKLRPLIKNLLR